jgi:hypothetical protein
MWRHVDSQKGTKVSEESPAYIFRVEATVYNIASHTTLILIFMLTKVPYPISNYFLIPDLKILS